MPEIQGVSPNVLWTTIYGLVGLGLIFMVGYNVYNAIHTIIERKRLKQQEREPDLADKISAKVMEKITPKLKEIEDKLDKDKNRLDNHERLISDVQTSQNDIKSGMVAICKTLVVIMNYGNFGDTKEVKEANSELQRYLAGKIVN